MQTENLRCLPENYQMKFYTYHYLSWPEALFVAEAPQRDPCGYVLAMISEATSTDAGDSKGKGRGPGTAGANKGDKPVENGLSGHVTSLAVSRPHRQCGLAAGLMHAAHRAMREYNQASRSSLHVRVSNKAALSLYFGLLSYKICSLEDGYYYDNEDAFYMKKVF